MTTSARSDISEWLIHFTKDETIELAFQRLHKILREETLTGSSNLICGGFKCVCFSEAPLASVADGLVNKNYYSRYSRFGIMVRKDWIFGQGGRPVIYEPREEIGHLAENIRWRHVTFDLNEESPMVDFTWEREWRIQCDALRLTPYDAKVVILDDSDGWAARLQKDYEADSAQIATAYQHVIGDAAFLMDEPFHWEIVPVGGRKS